MSSLPLAPHVTVIGAGPVGCVSALQFAQRGASVLLLEAGGSKGDRLAGEWLHPPGLKILEDLGVPWRQLAGDYEQGKGFVVFPEDKTDPIHLSYPSGVYGLSCCHTALLKLLRETAANHLNILYLSEARVTRIESQTLQISHKKLETIEVFSEQIIGADGRGAISRKAVGDRSQAELLSYMAGMILHDVQLPFEGYGHVLPGGPGPVLAYRIGPNAIRMMVDVPVSTFQGARDRQQALWEDYSAVMPSSLLPAFKQAITHQKIVWCANRTRPRVRYGRPGLALIGDAAGHCHPITATGMTLGFQDAATLANSQTFKQYERTRLFNTYVPELLSKALYRAFTEQDETAIALRQAIYKMWRQASAERMRTIRLLAVMETRFTSFCRPFLKGLGIAIGALVVRKLTLGQWKSLFKTVSSLSDWLKLVVETRRIGIGSQQ